eukprot:scaffold13275_cov73-Cylindrotheca_fusiformis.AAC.1
MAASDPNRILSNLVNRFSTGTKKDVDIIIPSSLCQSVEMLQVGTENCLNTMNGCIARRRSSINYNLSHVLLAIAIFAAMVTGASAFVPPSSPRATVSIIGHPRNHNNANFREGNEFTTAASFNKSRKRTRLSDMKSDVVDAIGGTSMLQYFLKAVIDSSVPALFAIVTIGFAAFFLRKRSREEDEG